MKFAKAGRAQPPFRPQGGQTFRDAQIWQLEVEDLLKSNQETILALYKHFRDVINPETGKKITELTCALCLPIGALLDLTDEQVTEAYSYAKMIPGDEMQSYRRYYHM